MSFYCIILIAFSVLIFSSAQSAVIRGTIYGPGDNYSLIVNHLQFIGHYYQSFQASCDEKGRFYAEITIEQTQDVNIEIGDEIIELLLTPDDSVDLDIYVQKGRVDSLIFRTGTFAEVNNELFSIRFILRPMSQIEVSRKSKNIVDKIYKTNQASLKQLEKEKLQDTTRLLARSFITYDAKKKLIDYYWQVGKSSKSTFDIDSFLKGSLNDSLNFCSYYNTYITYLMQYLIKENNAAKKPFTAEQFKPNIYTLKGISNLYARNLAMSTLMFHTLDSERYIAQTTLIGSLLPAPFKSTLDKKFIQATEPPKWQHILDKHQGKVLYVDIWASWCGPCREEIPYSIELLNNIKDHDIELVFLSADHTEEIWKRSVENLFLNKGSHFFIDDSMREVLAKEGLYGSFPRYFIVDKKGNIIDKDAARPSVVSATKHRLNTELMERLILLAK